MCKIIVIALLLAACDRTLPVTEPHLEVKATHQDLGRWIKGTVAYNEQYQGTVDYVNVPLVFYQSNWSDCTIALSVVDSAAYDADIDFYVDGRSHVMAPDFRNNTLQVEDNFDTTAILDPGVELPICIVTPPRVVQGFYYHFVRDNGGYIGKLQTYRSDEVEVVNVTKS
jgi:hypothetical protein